MKKTLVKGLFILSMSFFIFSCSEDDDESIDPNSINLSLNATVSASSTFDGYSPDNVIDDDLNTTVGAEYSWSNNHSPSNDITLPQWIALDFGSDKTFSRVELYSSEDFIIQDYQLQYWDGNDWQLIREITGNTSLVRSHTFDEVTSSKVRVLGTRGPSNQTIYVRINELQVWGN
ncbi:MAG: discoidin domain-containing protein [Bacteroidota bacterium]